MSLPRYKNPKPFLSKKKTKNITITFVDEDDVKKDKDNAALFKSVGFHGKANQGYITHNAKGAVKNIFWGVSDAMDQIDGARLCDFIAGNLSQNIVKTHSFDFKIAAKLKKRDWDAFTSGWGFSHYSAELYKKDSDNIKPALVIPDVADKKYVTANYQAASLLKNLINTAPNDLGTDELAAAAKALAKDYDAKIKIIKDEALNKQNFPMIYTVGKASPRRPQLVDMKWGKKTHPKVTIVGKGIIYDTGGLNLKPGMFMRDMKKDMGGAAHALAVAKMIMAMKLPVQLRVLLPIAENAVAGNSYRPGDVLNSRKGLTVEIGDTDAEGRLVVADALTYACEDKPDLLLDFCTLTGAARVALGYDIPAFFSNNDVYLDDLRDEGLAQNDPVWPLPLWSGYRKEMDSAVADICNDGKGRAGAIHGALFLNDFVDPKIDWIHLDCYAWEQSGKPGRPQGAADTGMRAVYHFIKNRYA